MELSTFHLTSEQGDFMALRGILLVVIILLLTLTVAYLRSGKYQQKKAEYLGYSTMCIDGVKYLQFSTGATVKMNPDGTVARCD